MKFLTGIEGFTITTVTLLFTGFTYEQLSIFME